MGFLQTLKKRHDRNWISIHIGSGDQAKGLYGMALVLCFDALSQAGRGPPPQSGDSRDFAAVMAQTGLSRRFSILSTYSIK
jgi:hypothetical protein